MKILLLSDANSPHTIKLAVSLAKNNIKVCIFTLGNLVVNDYDGYENIVIESPNLTVVKTEGSLSKNKVFKIIAIIK